MSNPTNQRLSPQEVITEQLELVELVVTYYRLMIRDAQQRSLFRPCANKTLGGCVWCRFKRYVLRKRFSN